jgi:hypothetical protein
VHGAAVLGGLVDFWMVKQLILSLEGFTVRILKFHEKEENKAATKQRQKKTEL